MIKLLLKDDNKRYNVSIKLRNKYKELPAKSMITILIFTYCIMPY